MSRVAKNPIQVPKGVDVTVTGAQVSVKGPKGTLQLSLREDVAVTAANSVVQVEFKTDLVRVQAGTTRALIANMVKGVSQGFEEKLKLQGVGYRAQLKGNVLNLGLGFSHPIDYAIPTGITIETPTQVDIVIRGADKQKVGAVAAEIRAFRKPEVYKGKGVRYADEQVILKETKKK